MFCARMVEEALMPPCAQIGDEVAALMTPKCESQLKGAAPAVVWSCEQPKEPLFQVKKNPAWQVASWAP